MADKVMRMTEPSAQQQTLFAPPTAYINLSTSGTQQEEDKEELTEALLPDMQYDHAFDTAPLPPPSDEEEEKQLQRKGANTGETTANTATENYISTLNGKGTPLTREERTFLNQGLITIFLM